MNKPTKKEAEILSDYLFATKNNIKLNEKIVVHQDSTVSFYSPIKTLPLCLNCHGTPGKEISENAYSCPNCGNPISEVNPKQQPKIEVKGQREGCFLRTLNCGCMITFAIIGLIILLALFSNA